MANDGCIARQQHFESRDRTKLDEQWQRPFQDELHCIRRERFCHGISAEIRHCHLGNLAAIDLASAIFATALEHAWRQIEFRRRISEPRHERVPPWHPPADHQYPDWYRPAERRRLPEQQHPAERRRLPEPQRPAERRVERQPVTRSDTQAGTVFELHNLRYATGKHRTPDAVVYVPQGFDANKPIRVMVYNHGLSTDVKQAFKNSHLENQLANADPNTILIVPEWQTQPQTRLSGDKDRFHQKDFFKNMLDEIFSKTPALAGKSSKDIDSMGIITHSGGYRATISQLYNNGLNDKVTSLTVLDSMYNPKGFDRWVSGNIRDLATGKKHLLVVYTDHLSTQSNGLADRIEAMLRKERIQTDAETIVRDRRSPKSVTSSHVLRNSGIVFKYSTLAANGRDAHNTMTGYYVAEVVNSERRFRGGR